jgi:NAD(P)H-flavin reductase
MPSGTAHLSLTAEREDVDELRLHLPTLSVWITVGQYVIVVPQSTVRRAVLLRAE